jgi:transglutaminase/protease-like cytokinesis protein 3
MTSSAAGSVPSESSGNIGAGGKVKEKAAKLAVQSPGGKIIRLARKADEGVGRGMEIVDGKVVGSVWESVVKVQERGVWRGLVLADRSARWCVWGEWECV